MMPSDWAVLQVSPKRRVLGLDHRLGQVAIDNAQLAVEERVAVTVSVDARGLEGGAGWEGSGGGTCPGVRGSSSIGTVEHEKLVAAGGDAPLDAEEVAKRRAFTVAKRVSVVLGVTRVHGPTCETRAIVHAG